MKTAVSKRMKTVYRYIDLTDRMKTKISKKHIDKGNDHYIRKYRTKNQRLNSTICYQRLMDKTEYDHFEPYIIKIFEDLYLHTEIHKQMKYDDEMEINEEHIQQIPTTTDYKYFDEIIEKK